MKKTILLFSLFLSVNVFSDGFNGIRDSKVRRDLATETYNVLIATSDLNTNKLDVSVHDSSMAIIEAQYLTNSGYASSSNTFQNVFLNISSGTETSRLYNLYLASFTINDGNVASKLATSVFQSSMAVIESQYLKKNTTDTAQGLLLNGSLRSAGIESNYFMGNFGIGTTNPTAHVCIYTSDVNDTIGIRRSANDKNGILKFYTDGIADWVLGERNTVDSSFRLYNYGTDSDAMTILRASGNVGIGITNPAEKLVIDDATGVSSNVWVGGYVSAGHYIDRTPYPETLQIAYDSINSISKKYSGGVDHDKLNSFVKHERKYIEKKFNIITKSTDTINRIEIGRDLSATVSALVVVQKDLIKTIQGMSTEMLNLNKRISLLENK